MKVFAEHTEEPSGESFPLTQLIEYSSDLGKVQVYSSISHTSAIQLRLQLRSYFYYICFCSSNFKISAIFEGKLKLK